jgi:hypothetical protein
MFCPECRVEYRSGFRRCSDCDVELVEVLAEKAAAVGAAAGDGESVMIWKCANQEECVWVCRVLRDADIAYTVDQIPYGRDDRMRVTFHFSVLISRDEVERAQKVLDIEAPQDRTVVDERDNTPDPSLELADAGPSAADDRVRRESYLEEWFPEDATVLVWTGDSDGWAETIERALDANLIHCRRDSDGKKEEKIFVMEQDAELAEEIVREIVEGRPRR